MAKLFWLTSADPDLCMDSSGKENAESILDSGNAFPTLEAAQKALREGIESMFDERDAEEIDLQSLSWDEPVQIGEERVWRLWHEATSTWAQIREIDLPWL